MNLNPFKRTEKINKFYSSLNYLGNNNWSYYQGKTPYFNATTDKSETYSTLYQMMTSRFSAIQPNVSEEEKRSNKYYDYIYNDRYYSILDFNNVMQEVLDDYFYHGVGYVLIETRGGELIKNYYLDCRSVNYYGDSNKFKVNMSKNNTKVSVEFTTIHINRVTVNNGYNTEYKYVDGNTIWYLGFLIFRSKVIGGRDSIVEFLGIKSLLSKWILLDNLSLEYNSKLLENGGIISLIFRFDPTKSMRMLKSPKDRQEFKDKTKKELANNDGTPILTDATEVIDLTRNLRDMNYEVLTKTAKENIALYLGLQLPSVMQTTSTHDNYETGEFQTMQLGVLPVYRLYINMLQSLYKNIFGLRSPMFEVEIDKRNSLIVKLTMFYVEGLDKTDIASFDELRNIAGLKAVDEKEKQKIIEYHRNKEKKGEDEPTAINPTENRNGGSKNETQNNV